MKFTSDGYTESLSPRPVGLILGLVVTIAGVGALVTGWYCPGVLGIVIGPLFALNETGSKRIRVTRTKLLMEEESRVRGLLIGPRRSRMTWAETESVELTADGIVLKGSKQTLVIGKGGTELELSKLKARIDQAREDS